MNRDRLWLIGIGILIFAVLVGGWFVGVSPIVDQASAADSQRANIAATNDSSAARISVLRQQFANIGELQGQLDKLKLSVPETSDTQAFLREIDSLTSQDQVQLTGVTFQNATAYVPPVSPPPRGSTGTGSTATPSPSPSATASSPTSGTTPARPASTSRLALIPVQLTVTGAYDAVMNFIGGIQMGQRLFLVTSTGITLSPSDGKFTGVMGGYIYALPTAAAAAAATPATPTPNPSASTKP
ncbi:MAG: hypothetical protein JWO18_2567 [Microbacteriaceae bacterium]|jgi:Tfp pilus assembly protein PilO|nr:hypothetical protein [Microbacteriaceae bacterium]